MSNKTLSDKDAAEIAAHVNRWKPVATLFVVEVFMSQSAIESGNDGIYVVACRDGDLPIASTGAYHLTGPTPYRTLARAIKRTVCNALGVANNTKLVEVHYG